MIHWLLGLLFARIKKPAPRYLSPEDEAFLAEFRRRHYQTRK